MNFRATALLAFALMSALPTSGNAQFLYTITNGTVIITGGGGSGNVVIPEAMRGLPVTTIGSRAFQGRDNVTSVTIPNTVTNIADSAFNFCQNLTNVALPESLISLGDLAFCFCAKLESISLRSNLKEIGANVFLLCSRLTNINVSPANLWFASQDGVLFNKNRTELIIYPQARAGDYEVPEGVETLGWAAFQFCGGLTGVTLPDSVTDLAFGVFQNCSNLAKVKLGNQVSRIGYSAFAQCVRLTTITIPSSVLDLPIDAFVNCTALTNITVDSLNITYSSKDGVLFDRPQATLLRCPQAKAGNYVVPDTVQRLGEGAFSYCSNVTSIAVGDGVTNIDRSAFSYCASLRHVTLPNALSQIKNSVFLGCTSLMDATIPLGVRSIEAWAFRDCHNLSTIIIPESVTNIGVAAFSFCTNLTVIAVDAHNPAYSSADGIVFDKSRTTLIVFPAGRGGAYAVPDGVTRIGQYAFNGCTGLTNLLIPKSVSKVGEGAFMSCRGLVSVYCTGNAPDYGPSIFGDCNATVYYLPGTRGWDWPWGDRPVVRWNLRVQTSSPGFGIQANHFGLPIVGSGGFTILVEVATNLAHPVWTPVGTNTLDAGTAYFSDPAWTNYPSRFYRLRLP